MYLASFILLDVSDLFVINCLINNVYTVFQKQSKRRSSGNPGSVLISRSRVEKYKILNMGFKATLQ